MIIFMFTIFFVLTQPHLYRKIFIHLKMKSRGLQPIPVERTPFHNQNLVYPLTDEEVISFIEKVKRENPIFLFDIKKIQIIDREPQLSMNIFGSYRVEPHTYEKTIHLYPVEKVGDLYKFPYYKSEKNELYFLIEEHEMKRELLFTLGHEIGHNYIYQLKGTLHGEYVELEANERSRQLGCHSEDHMFPYTKDVYHNGQNLGRVDLFDSNLWKTLNETG